MNKYICIHGHFYQPPRENPWLNEVEIQESAYPFHDWNSRISAECYGRNGASRIIDNSGKILDIVNNYSYISFNFGPTLLEWLEKCDPATYQLILEADKESIQRYSGHGSAIAQAYNHMIMPLANERDKETQIIWGIKDFEHRFKRKPEGMWCGETAMNIETLELLAKHGVKFTILSPYQAGRARKIGQDEEDWEDVSNAKVDPTKAYLCNLPSGNSISIFFYDGPISQGIAFERLLNSGEIFASRLLDVISDDDNPQLVNIATDGETYGHHHRFGEMALSYCIDQIENSGKARITVYGEFLELFPPEDEIEILENTSWSCYHGVERWRSNCGCNSGMNPGFHQEWRGPLRDAFDWVRDESAVLYEKMMKLYSSDPWKVRDAYINVILDRSPQNVDAFILEHTGQNLSNNDKIEFLKLLEQQFHTMLMYTSCGWFFDEVTGIESIQDICYATRAIQLTKEVTGVDLEQQFIKLLEKAPSNIKAFGNAGNAYKKLVQPEILDMLRVGAHYAVSSLFANYEETADVYCYKVSSEIYDYYEAGKYKLAIGKILLRSKITWEEKHISFAVLHLGEHQIYGGVREFVGDNAFAETKSDIEDAFHKGHVQEVLILMDKHFGTHNYSFWHLFKDDQKRIIDQVLESTLVGIEGMFRAIYENNYPLMRAFNELNMALPMPLKITGDFIINSKIKRILGSKSVDLKELRNIKDEISRLKIELDTVTLNYIATKRIKDFVDRLEMNPEDLDVMKDTIDLIEVCMQISLQPDLWDADNVAFRIRENYYSTMKAKAKTDINAQNWIEVFDNLISHLNLKPVEAIESLQKEKLEETYL
jgi:alpha-amylase/alpha-mannosidase (GH57 family)